MKTPMLEVTFRHGRPLAAYLQLESADRAVARTAEVAPSLLVDYDAAEAPLGLEILAFDEATLARINEFLASIGKRVLTSRELAPLRAA